MGASTTALFPEDADTDLYSILGLEETASHEAVRKAYRRLSLLHHPDKVATRPAAEREAAKTTFQRVGFAYAVLSDDKRRARYDKTGSTEEGALDVEPDAGWEAYFAELWSGEISSQTLSAFFDAYEGSAEELEDLTRAYVDSDGDIDYLLAHVPARDNVTAEVYLTQRVQDAIESGALKTTTQWTKSSTDIKARLKRRKAAAREAKEAEAAAKELGVHEKLFGNPKGTNPKAAKGDSEKALQALIQQRGAARMDALIGNLESKYAGKEKRGSPGKGNEPEGKRSRILPDEEGEFSEFTVPSVASSHKSEFARIQQGIEGRRRGGRQKR